MNRAASSIENSGFTLTKSTRLVTLQGVPLLNFTSTMAEVTILVLEYPENNQKKKATSNVIFSRTADRITEIFCVTTKKIKPNDILNCAHSTRTLNYCFCHSISDELAMF